MIQINFDHCNRTVSNGHVFSLFLSLSRRRRRRRRRIKKKKEEEEETVTESPPVTGSSQIMSKSGYGINTPLFTYTPYRYTFVTTI